MLVELQVGADDLFRECGLPLVAEPVGQAVGRLGEGELEHGAQHQAGSKEEDQALFTQIRDDPFDDLVPSGKVEVVGQDEVDEGQPECEDEHAQCARGQGQGGRGHQGRGAQVEEPEAFADGGGLAWGGFRHGRFCGRGIPFPPPSALWGSPAA